jgi:hypothetical protein
MQERFGAELDVEVHTVDSPAAADYVLKGSTNVFVNGQWVALDVATAADRMESALRELLAGKG